MRQTNIDLLIIGGGPAGLAAAISAARAGVQNIIIIDRLAKLGGILPQCIHNGFGLRYFQEELTGPEYAARFTGMVAEYPQITVKLNTMVIDLKSKPAVEATTVNPQDGLVCYRPKALILAMGCRERPRGAINIPGSRPAGIYSAGTVQRMINIEGYRPGERVVILGSGDIGLIMARRLTLENIFVPAVIELMPYSSGLARNLVQCLDDFQIPLYLSHTVTQICGSHRVEAVRVAPVDENRQPVIAKEFEIPCDTLVLSVGLIPENELSFMAGVTLDPATAGPIVDSDYQTTASGIFACGNVVHVHDLVDDVSDEGHAAGKAAADYINSNLKAARVLKLEMGRNIRSVVPQFIRKNDGIPTNLFIRVSFPEKDVRLCVGSNAKKQRIVTPGETLHYTVDPAGITDYRDSLPIYIEAASSGESETASVSEKAR